MLKPNQQTHVEHVHLSPFVAARLAEQAAELSLQAGRVIGLDEYLLMLVQAAMTPRSA